MGHCLLNGEENNKGKEPPAKCCGREKEKTVTLKKERYGLYGGKWCVKMTEWEGGSEIVHVNANGFSDSGVTTLKRHREGEEVKHITKKN